MEFTFDWEENKEKVKDFKIFMRENKGKREH